MCFRVALSIAEGICKYFHHFKCHSKWRLFDHKCECECLFVSLCALASGWRPVQGGLQFTPWPCDSDEDKCNTYKMDRRIEADGLLQKTLYLIRLHLQCPVYLVPILLYDNHISAGSVSSRPVLYSMMCKRPEETEETQGNALSQSQSHFTGRMYVLFFYDVNLLHFRLHS